MTKKDATQPDPALTPTTVTRAEPVAAQPVSPQANATILQAEQDTGLSITSMILGILSLVGFGLFTGIPAIITGSIALKKKRGNRGMSIAGVVTGSIGTFFSLMAILFVVIVIILSAINPGDTHYQYTMPDSQSHMRMFDSSRT